MVVFFRHIVSPGVQIAMRPSILQVSRFSTSKGFPRPHIPNQQAPPGTPPPPVDPSAPAKQPFVQTTFEVGEWDPDTRTNPIYRPKFNTRMARIISADDFARRPPVGFTGEFQNFEEAMVTLTWMTHKQQREIYDVYTQMILEAEHQKITTSHEYVIRVIAHKYQVTSERVAGVIQLQHNEQQLIEAGFPVDQEFADLMDQKYLAEIEAAYRSQQGSSPKKQVQTTPPKTFIEDPVGVGGQQDKRYFKSVSDLHVVGDEGALEGARARKILDNYRYKEDKDPRTVSAPMDKNCKRLLEKCKSMPRPDQDPIVLAQRKKNAAKEPEWPKNHYRRPRWDYICQTTTEQMENDNPCNTLVERDGEVKAATIAEVASTPWKAKRDNHAFSYAGVQQAWMDRVKGTDKVVWGPSSKKEQPVPVKVHKKPEDGEKSSNADGEEAPEEGTKEDSPVEEASGKDTKS